MPVDPKQVEKRFLDEVKKHTSGWRDKVARDFTKAAFKAELTKLASDPVYPVFGLDSTEYVLTRLIGRMSISVGRRLGEIYDKLPRYVAAARFNLKPKQIAAKFKGLELDIALQYNQVSADDKDVLMNVIKDFDVNPADYKGIGIEIRYNFNPNDAARLQKEKAMARHLKAKKLFPLYLVYSSISPRDDAIRGLTKAGWSFLQGTEASDFTTKLFSIDFMATIKKKKAWGVIQDDVRDILSGIFVSEAFKQLSAKAPMKVATARSRPSKTMP